MRRWNGWGHGAVSYPLAMSDLPRYRNTILFSGPEILSIRNPVKNTARRYIAGMDPIKAWDAQQMVRLGLEPQRIGPPGSVALTG